MIPWYVFALGSVVMGTLFSIFRKQALKKVHSLQFAATRSIAASILVLFLIPFIDLDLNPKVILLMYLMSSLAMIGIFFMSKAYKHMELSILTPLTNIKPIFVAVLGLLFLGEVLSLKQWAGIFIILLGAYILEADHKFDNLLRPILLFFKSRHSIYLLFAIIIFSVTSVMDKIVVSKFTDPFTLVFFIWIFMGINMNILHGAMYGFKEIKDCFKKTTYLPFAVAFFTLSANTLAYFSLQQAYVSLVTPVLMISTLLVVLIGGEFFHEKNLLYRIGTSLFMLIGVYLIVV